MLSDRHPGLDCADRGEGESRGGCYNKEADRRGGPCYLLGVFSVWIGGLVGAWLGLFGLECHQQSSNPYRRIVLAQLKETLDYYVRLRVAEIEGDMLKALIGNNSEKLMQKYRLWVAAKADLATPEGDQSRKT